MKRQNVGFIVPLLGLAIVPGHLWLELSMDQPGQTHPQPGGSLAEW